MWIGFVAKYLVIENLIVFLEYDGTLKIFDMLEHKIIKQTKPLNKIVGLHLVETFNVNEFIMYGSGEAYIVDVNKDTYKKIEGVNSTSSIISILKITNSRVFAINLGGNRTLLLDENYNQICEIDESKFNKNSQIYDLLHFSNAMIESDKRSLIQSIYGEYFDYNNDLNLVKKTVRFEEYEDLKKINLFKMSKGRKYIYMLSLISNLIYIFDGNDYSLIRRLRLNNYVSDVLIDETNRVFAITSFRTLCIYKYDNILDFPNYSK